jgi:hypothetical protein
LARKLNEDEDSLLENEMLLLQGTCFQLMVFHPFVSLDVFLEKLFGLTAEDASAECGSDLSRVKARSRELIRCAMCGDCGFLFSPADIAVASLTLAVSELTPQKSDELGQLINADKQQQASPANIFNPADSLGGSDDVVAAGAPASPRAESEDPAALFESLQQQILDASRQLDEAEIERLNQKLEEVCLGENAGSKCGSPKRTKTSNTALELSPW